MNSAQACWFSVSASLSSKLALVTGDEFIRPSLVGNRVFPATFQRFLGILNTSYTEYQAEALGGWALTINEQSSVRNTQSRL